MSYETTVDTPTICAEMADVQLMNINSKYRSRTTLTKQRLGGVGQDEAGRHVCLGMRLG